MLLCSTLKTVAVIFVHKQFRSCQPETVNTLLYITYHKHIRSCCRLSRNAGKYKLLNIIAVLILIRHYLLIILPEFFCHLARNYLTFLIFTRQYCKGKMLHIIKINNPVLSFSLCKRMDKINRQLNKFLHGRCHLI